MVYEDLEARGITAQIAKRGEQTPIQTDGRWVVERTNSWMNNFGKLRRCTERHTGPHRVLHRPGQRHHHGT
jgi:hypothetical protein